MGLHLPGPPAPHREGREAGAARPVRARSAGRAFVTAAAALAGGWLLSRLHLPVAWMLGPMLAAAGLNLAGWLHPVPPGLWRAAQAVIGASVASNLTSEVWARLASAWPALVGSAAAGVAVGGLLGLALPRLVPVDRATALLGLVPGAASGMVAVSPDFGADPALVALVQYLRVMLVLLSAPLLVVVAHGLEGISGAAGPAGASGLAAAAGSGAVPAAQATASATAQASAAGAAGAHLWGAALGVAVVASGFVLGRRLPLPAASLLASMVVGALVATFAPVHPAVPFPVSVGAFLVLGTFVGSRFEREVLHRAWPVALAGVVSSLVLMAANLAIGWGLHLASGLPVLTAVLATAPGAIETMTAMAVATGANPGLVLSVHVARFFLALMLGPLVTGLLTGRRRERARPGAAAGRTAAPAPAAGPGAGAGSHQAFASAASRPRRPR